MKMFSVFNFNERTQFSLRPKHFSNNSRFYENTDSCLYSICNGNLHFYFLLYVCAGVTKDDLEGNRATVKQTLVSGYKNNLEVKLKGEIKQSDNHLLNDQFEDKKFGRWSTSWWQQFKVLLRRGVKERRHESFSGLRIGQVLVVALLSGLLWWRSDLSHLQDQVTSFLPSFLNLW